LKRLKISRKLFRAMKTKHSFSRQHLFQLFFVVLFFSLSAQAQVEWRQVSQAELDMKTPKVEADADAEAIFWEVRLDDEKRKRMFYSHYVRVKIFTERGREKFSKFDIPFYKGRTIEDVAARVIKPDGATVELQPSDIFEREIIKSGKISVKAKSFAVPGIAPGVIVEYQYKETLKNDSASGERLIFQRDIPMQKITYYVRPYKDSSLNFDFQNMPRVKFVPNSEGFYVGMRENVPAFREEPQMPPDDEVKQWVLLSYDSAGYGFNWSRLGNYWSQVFDEIIEPNKEIQQKARELTAGFRSDDERLKILYDFVQKQIKNMSFDRSFTAEQRENIKNKKASDTLKHAMGSSVDIDLLFASLVRAVGFDVNVMYSGNRSDNFFNYEKDLSARFLHHSGIAVRRGNEWKPFNPGVPFVPFGMTFWHDEAISTMIAGSGGYTWIRLPVADYTKNLSHRTAKFKLTEDGTLEGVVRVEHNGHSAIMRRSEMFEKSPNEREETIKKSWKQMVATAEISDFAMENFDDSLKPYVYSFKVRVPNYAQKTGKRLFLQPGFFEYGTAPLFASETRKYSIYFEYPWSEDDEIEIELPKTFEADSVESPGLVNDTKGIGSLNIKIDLAKETNILKFSRQFYFGGKGNILFAATSYTSLKGLFDSFHKADTYSISLKQKQ
jgi:hypothetical protein